MIRSFLLAAFLVFAPLDLVGADSTEFEARSGNIYTLNQYQGAGRSLLLWLPSEYGLGEGYKTVAADLAKLGVDVWVLDIHESLMLPTGRRSLDGVSRDDMLAVVELAQDSGFEGIFLSGGSRGAMLALQLAYDWQVKADGQGFVKGLVMFSPHLFEGRNLPGDRPEMVELSKHSNLPLYLIQPEYSTKFVHTREIVRRLQSGGSPVYLHYQKGVQDGFQSRPKDDLAIQDLEARANLAGLLGKAMGVLEKTRPAPFRDELSSSAGSREEGGQSFVRWELNRLLEPMQAPSLQLDSFKGEKIDLRNLRDAVVVVNFWATWCEPCVREMPSLDRLLGHFEGSPFRVLAVNINESRVSVAEFLGKIPVSFDILMDQDGKSVRDWNVYAYPSTFVIGKSGQVEYVYRGALEWDDEDIIDSIEELF